MKIAVVGLGYVGLSNAALLARQHQVVALDTDPAKVEALKSWTSPIEDLELAAFLATRPANLSATMDAEEAFKDADWIIIATPTDYDPDNDYFDTSSVEAVTALVAELSPSSYVVIKSTVPVGYTQGLRKQFPDLTIVFSPEFLREGSALRDNLHPSRVVVGDRSEVGAAFGQLLADAAEDDDVPVLLTDSTEAEAIKLFANTFLALRVAYFNELDTYALSRGLDTTSIIEGIGLDPRIGSHYNNPSFGYGGYCLPKDSKQLLANYHKVPQNLMSAVVSANRTRKEFIASDILKRDPEVVGVFRLAMKTGSDNFRQSSVQGVMRLLRGHGVRVVVHDPALDVDVFDGYEVIRDIDEFKEMSDVIVANRWNDDLDDVEDKVYTRDLYGRD